MKDRPFDDLQRRGFLIRCCEAAGALLLSYSASPIAFALERPPGPEIQFHPDSLHPHYREKTSLDEALLNLDSATDVFVSEQRHDAIAVILDQWRAALLNSPGDVNQIGKALSGNFAGTGWQPTNSVSVREISRSLEVQRCRFPQPPLLPAQAFLTGLKSAIAGFSKLLTAEFQITQIDITATGLTTRIRYELVATGQGFHREARIGEWTLSWEVTSGNGYQVTRWQAHEEERSRSLQPLFVETTRNAFEGCESFAQMEHGADYWRTVLDTSCGIDLYGHNGVCAGDIDGSGRDSIYVCQPAGLPNRLYRNRGDGRFEDITESSGLGLLDNTACALCIDVDNDGRQDLVVVRANGPLLFLNQGGGRFRLKEGAFQFANPPAGTFTGAAAADYDRDGHLDIYFCLYTFYQGADQYKYPTPYFAAENGPPNFLMRNNGDGTFRDVTAQSGLYKNNNRYSFCCAWGDADGNGWPDLYVVNDFGRKNLYRNNGDATFTDVAAEAGVEDVGAGMSVCWLDYDNDGAQDLYVANMWTAAGERITNDGRFQAEASKQARSLYRKHSMGNSLLRNNGQGVFRDKTEGSQTGMGRWSWSSDAWDFNHDGFADLYIANGMISGPDKKDLNSFFWRQVVAKSPNSAMSSPDYEQGWNAINELIRAGHSWSGYERNLLYSNNHDGTFSDLSGVLGLDFAEDCRAFVLSDLDGDGRQEMLMKSRNAPQLRLIKNVIPDLSPAISFSLQGTKSNRDAIGVRVTIETSAGRQTRYVQAGSGFLSQHSKELFFGLGHATGSISATIRWPSGLTQQLNDLPSNHRIFVTEGAESRSVAFQPSRIEPRSNDSPVHESLPETTASWLLVPVSAPDFTVTDKAGKSWTLSSLRGKPVLLCFSVEDLPVSAAPRIVAINPQRSESDDTAATYNLLFRYLFDNHRDLPIPTAFLIDEQGLIVKVYSGHIPFDTVRGDCQTIPRTGADRLAKALPFSGVRTSYDYGRNYLSLGSIFFQRGYIDAAGGFFGSALKDDPSSAEANYGLGSACLRQNKNEQARRYFERTTTLKPAYPETAPNAWNNLGLLAARDGDTAKAIDCFTQALQIDPNHFVSLQNLGNAYRQQKRWEKARTTLERALAIKPLDPEANYGLGMVYAQWDDAPRAYDFLQKALQARPEYPEALNNLGVLYLRTRRPDDAVATFEKCIRVAPAFDQSYLNLARVYEMEGDSEKARTVLNALLAQYPGNVLAQQALEQLK